MAFSYINRWYSKDYLIAFLRDDGIVFETWRWFMIRGIKIVSIPVSDQDVSLKFYTEKRVHSGGS
jgi:hypothetical protein